MTANNNNNIPNNLVSSVTSNTSAMVQNFKKDNLLRTIDENSECEDGKREFYTMAVNMKLALPSNHPGREYMISDLYDECVALNVQKEQWAMFLRTKFLGK